MMKTVSSNQKAYSVKTAAAMFDASVPFVRNLIRDGKLRAKKIGKKVYVLDADLQSLLENQPDWTPTNSNGEEK